MFVVGMLICSVAYGHHLPESWYYNPYTGGQTTCPQGSDYGTNGCKANIPSSHN